MKFRLGEFEGVVQTEGRTMSDSETHRAVVLLSPIALPHGYIQMSVASFKSASEALDCARQTLLHLGATILDDDRETRPFIQCEWEQLRKGDTVHDTVLDLALTVIEGVSGLLLLRPDWEAFQMNVAFPKNYIPTGHTLDRLRPISKKEDGELRERLTKYADKLVDSGLSKIIGNQLKQILEDTEGDERTDS